MRLTRELILGSRLTPAATLRRVNPKPRKEEWGVCKVCCSRGVVVNKGGGGRGVGRGREG